MFHHILKLFKRKSTTTETPAATEKSPDVSAKPVGTDAQMVARKSAIDDHATLRRLENTHIRGNTGTWNKLAGEKPEEES